mmetsp:Transcript_81836/g.227970  ORF Transcript_81836/g.227970 Transcript_81836/m.227970 type:complete len:360 (+) Transcript_81836:81-1160(+)
MARPFPLCVQREPSSRRKAILLVGFALAADDCFKPGAELLGRRDRPSGSEVPSSPSRASKTSWRSRGDITSPAANLLADVKVVVAPTALTAASSSFSDLVSSFELEALASPEADFEGKANRSSTTIVAASAKPSVHRKLLAFLASAVSRRCARSPQSTKPAAAAILSCPGAQRSAIRRAIRSGKVVLASRTFSTAAESALARRAGVPCTLLTTLTRALLNKITAAASSPPTSANATRISVSPKLHWPSTSAASANAPPVCQFVILTAEAESSWFNESKVSTLCQLLSPVSPAPAGGRGSEAPTPKTKKTVLFPPRNHFRTLASKSCSTIGFGRSSMESRSHQQGPAARSASQWLRRWTR